eukprot:833975_1
MTAERDNSQHDQMPKYIEDGITVAYRAIGLGAYGSAIRFVGMPLEKMALVMNSAQVSGENQLRQAINLTFQDGRGSKSLLAPYKVVGPASGVAWFLQYSVMGGVFQLCDRALSNVLEIPQIPYGTQLMQDSSEDLQKEQSDVSTTLRRCAQIMLAPCLAGTIESVVANRAEVQRYYGIKKFSQIEAALKWNPISKLCGPAFIANSSRNCIMSATSFVVTPVLYRQYYPQEKKNKASLFWFGLGVNIFIGNVVAITQQALWGRALDYAASGKTVARNIHYRSVIQGGLACEGRSAFFTIPKWSTRVLMNAPVQGTLPWFYNECLPLTEDYVLNVAKDLYAGFWKNSYDNKNQSSQTGRGYTYCDEEGSQVQSN